MFCDEVYLLSIDILRSFFSFFQVTPHSVAERGLKAGDGVLFINNKNTDSLTHEEAKMEIIRSGNHIRFIIQR